MMTPEEVEHLVDTIVAKKLEPLEAKLDTIVQLLAKFEGAGTLMKLLFLGVAPLLALLAWAKDHVRL